MFKELINALRRKDAINELAADVGRMLESGQWMFERAAEALMTEADWDGMAEELYARDRRINEIEQSVRERIVTHLSVSDRADLSGCLVLMSVVKDAERIGDYCKNIFEVARFYRRAHTHPEYAATLDDIRNHTAPLFEQAKIALTAADRDVAYEVLDKAGKQRGRCDVVIRQLLQVHGEMAPDEAVAYVLLARFYKRVAAHLANIATSVVSPVPMIDYRGKQLPENADDD
ncbi:MAG: PhoU family transcriptional regulator [Phycisphaerae bacterium]|nr:PhoU family transcriptional regulator [Phycisphaerae bacterium]